LGLLETELQRAKGFKLRSENSAYTGYQKMKIRNDAGSSAYTGYQKMKIRNDAGCWLLVALCAKFVEKTSCCFICGQMLQLKDTSN
jgi:hypothetical protein